MKAKPYSGEPVLLCRVCKYIQKDGYDTDTWMTIGISTRLAIKTGYYSDPRSLARIFPFESEIRRFCFVLEAFDRLLSFQAELSV